MLTGRTEPLRPVPGHRLRRQGPLARVRLHYGGAAPLGRYGGRRGRLAGALCRPRTGRASPAPVPAAGRRADTGPRPARPPRRCRRPSPARPPVPWAGPGEARGPGAGQSAARGPGFGPRAGGHGTATPAKPWPARNEGFCAVPGVPGRDRDHGRHVRRTPPGDGSQPHDNSAVSSVAPPEGSSSSSTASARLSGSSARWRSSDSASRARPVSMSSPRRSTRPSV